LAALASRLLPRAAEVDFGFARALADDFAGAFEKAHEGFGFVESERAADGAVGGGADTHLAGIVFKRATPGLAALQMKEL
jgi:hypothetical protein